MAYSTATDLLGTLDDDQRTQLSTDSTPDAAGVTAKALDDASSWIDGYLGRFVPPMVVGTNATAVTMATLRVHCCIVARHWLFGRKAAGDPFKQQDEDFQSTRKFLEGVQAGRQLAGASEPVPPDPATVAGGLSIAGEIVFDDDSAVF